MMLCLRILPILIALVCIGLAFLPERHRTIKNPIYTEGVIIGKNAQRIQQGRTETEAFAPICRYTVGDKEITATSRDFVPDWQYRYLNGQQVKICCNQHQPDIFQICGNHSEWKRGILLTFGIATLLAYGVLLWQYH